MSTIYVNDVNIIYGSLDVGQYCDIDDVDMIWTRLVLFSHRDMLKFIFRLKGEGSVVYGLKLSEMHILNNT